STNSESQQEILLHVYDRTYTLDKKLVTGRSGKLFNMLKENQNVHKQLPYVLPDIPGNPKIFEIAMRFCYGYYEVHELKLSPEIVIPLICLAYYLEMNDEHSPNNLLNITINFFNQTVLPTWNETLEALQASHKVIKQAMQLNIIQVSLDSLVRKARINPHLLGEPITSHTYNHISDHNENNRVSARRRLFHHDCQSQDITILSLHIFELLMSMLIQEGTRPEYVAASLFRYTKKWIHVDEEGRSPSIDSENYQREIIEMVENLLPNQIGVLPCNLLFEMLRSAIILNASTRCRNGFETRIGKQLNEATVEDLLIPFQGYACEGQYDTECVKRILKAYYGNYTSSDQSGLIKVADLFDEFLAEVAGEDDLEKDTFISLLKLSEAPSVAMNRCSDGMYRAIDVYLNTHKCLTESEKDDVCQLLDCHRMSSAACTHAAQNERLPLRVAVQTLFVGQLHLRDAISSRIDYSQNGSQREEMVVVGDNDGEETKIEMEKIDTRVMELEKECLLMKKHIENGDGLKEKKKGVWKKLKRKFGCISSMSDCDCQVKKKVHPRNCF
ncbi:hypothetical protein AQUCO_01300897v1, partial [Aquilegia coerulea]